MTSGSDEPSGLGDDLATEPVTGPGDAVEEQAEEEERPDDGKPTLPLPPD